MLLRVHFCDNDFDLPIYKACEDIMDSIANGYKGKEVIKKYKEERDRYGLENIRKAIALASYGYYIAENACKLNKEVSYDFLKEKNQMDYLDKIITLEEVRTFNSNDDNSENCYIDFWNLKVHII